MVTGAAAQADVGAETVDKPLVAAARVGPAQEKHVAEPELDDPVSIRWHLSG